jgi:heme/copper-type cytochrome/quinol oxidase subunit 2
MAVVLTLSLIPYLWWQSRIIRRYRKREKVPPYTKKTMKILSFVFPVTPWVILSVIATVAYIVMQTLFGFDIFQIIVSFGMFAPPGVLIAAAAIMASILLWMLALTITGYIRVTARAKAYPKP